MINLQGLDLFDFVTGCAPVAPGLPVSTTDGKTILLF